MRTETIDVEMNRDFGLVSFILGEILFEKKYHSYPTLLVLSKVYKNNYCCYFSIMEKISKFFMFRWITEILRNNKSKIIRANKDLEFILLKKVEGMLAKLDPVIIYDDKLDEDSWELRDKENVLHFNGAEQGG